MTKDYSVLFLANINRKILWETFPREVKIDKTDTVVELYWLFFRELSLSHAYNM